MLHLEFLQRAGRLGDWTVSGFYDRFFRSFDISYYGMFRPLASDNRPFDEKLDQKYQNFIADVAKSITSAKVIYISVGEMGHQFMENPTILYALKTAYDKNSAEISIIHGPHVDPDTSTIFDFHEQGIVTLYQSKEYIPLHFVVIKDNNGKYIAYEENPHNEALWEVSKTGGIRKVYRSVYRVWYAIKNSSGYAKNLFEEFLRRKEDIQLPSPKHPGSVHSYKSPFFRVIRTSISYAFFRSITQPFLIISDQVELSFFMKLKILLIIIFLAVVRGIMSIVLPISSFVLGLALLIMGALLPALVVFSLISILLFLPFTNTYARPSFDTQTSAPVGLEFNVNSVEDFIPDQDKDFTAHPVNSIIESVATDQIALLALSELYTFASAYRELYSPDEIERSNMNINERDIDNLVEDSINEYNGSSEVREELHKNISWLKEEFRLGGKHYDNARHFLANTISELDKQISQSSPVKLSG